MSDGPDRDASEWRPHISRRRLLAVGTAAGGGLLSGCTGRDSTTADDRPTDGPKNSTATRTRVPEGTSTGARRTGTPTATPAEHTDWWTVELEAVRNGEHFTVAGLDGTVVLATFSAYCSVCTDQQRALVDVQRELGDVVTVVSLNVDPNESGSVVESYIQAYEAFDWRFAHSPFEMTRSLVARFGRVVTHPPSAPVVVACPGGRATLMAGGVTPAGDIASAVRGC